MTIAADPRSPGPPENGGPRPSRDAGPAFGLSPSSAVSRESGGAQPSREGGPASGSSPSSAISRESGGAQPSRDVGPASGFSPSSAVPPESGGGASDDAKELAGAPSTARAPESSDLGLPDQRAEPPGADDGHGSPTRPVEGEAVAASGPVAKRVYYSIGEVGVLTGLKPHVLRYWETQFDAVSPGKNRGGSRVYRVGDIRAILLVKRLLYEERFTIEGAKQKLDEMRQQERLGKESALRAEPAMLALIKEGLLAVRSALALPEAPAAPSPD